MSEFSAILDVISCVVTAVFETTVDVVCGAFLLGSCVVIWRWVQIARDLNNVKTRSDWRECCFGSALLSLFDCILTPMSVLILLSPLRWGHIRLLFLHATMHPNSYDSWDFRFSILSTALCSLIDITGYVFGALAFLSPFGRQVTIYKSASYYFRSEIIGDFDDRRKSTNKWSRRLIQHGLATCLDWIIVIFLIPFFIMAPSVWITTFTGIRELSEVNNKPTTLPHEYSYASNWMDWYSTLRSFLFVQIQHAVVDILLSPAFLLVCISPLRQPILMRTIRTENEIIRRQNERYVGHPRYNIDSYEYNYSVDLRAEVLVLALLAVADLLLLPMLLPLWLTQYRYRAIADVLFPPAEPPAVPHAPLAMEENATSPNAQATALDAASAPDTLSAEVGFEDAFAVPAATLSNKSSSEPFEATSAITAGENVEDAQARSTAKRNKLAGSSSDIEANVDFPSETHQEEEEHYILPSEADRTTTPTTPQTKLWGTAEFFLIAAQAGLLVCDVLMLLLPLPILYLTRVRWHPVGKLLQEDSVFLDRTSKVYGVVMDQMSMLLLDVLLVPLLLFVLCTGYRARPLWQIMANFATLHTYNLAFHWAILVNFVCILHDVFLLAPMVLLLPCCLAGYRASIVYLTLCNHRADNQRHVEASEASRISTSGGVDENINFVPPGKIRSRLWLQVLYSILDFPFVIISTLVFGTLWRAWELIAHLRYTAATTRLSYRELSNYNVNWAMESALRKAVVNQFVCLLRDILFLLPMVFVFGTLYRLPQLLGQFFSALLAGGKALTSDPILELESCHIEFPTRGGAVVNFGCTRRQTSAAAAEHPLSTPPASSTPSSSADAPADLEMAAAGVPTAASAEKIVLDPNCKVELHVVADAVWEAAGNILGKFLVSLVRGYLPLKLDDKKSVGWSEFVSDLTAAEVLEMSRTPSAATGASAVIPSQSLWIKLDFGTTKRSTLLKKLRLMPANAVLLLQLEGQADVTIADGVTQRKKVVLLRATPTLKCLIDILESTPVTTAASSDSVSGALPVEAILLANNRMRVPDPAEADSPKSREGNFVNSFNVMVTQSFVEIVIDLGMLIMFFVSLLSPLRFVRMLVALLEPESALPVRICANTLRTVHHLDNHLLEYRKQVGGPLNRYLKSKLPSMLFDVWDAYTRTNLRRNNNNPTIAAMHSFIQINDVNVEKVIKKVESYHLKPYQKLCKAAVKSLAYFGGCDKMEALLNERLSLHQDIVRFWYLRIAAEVQLLHSFLDESARAESKARGALPAVEDSTARAAAPSTATTAAFLATSSTAVQTKKQQKKQVTPVSSSRGELMLLIFTEEHDRVAQKLKRNELQMKELVQTMSSAISTEAGNTAVAKKTPVSCSKRFKNLYRSCGLLTRPIANTRKLIMMTAYQALSDLGFMVLFLFVLLTVVRALPMLRELRDNKTWSPLRYTTRWILIKHVKLLAQDLKHIAKFIAFTIAITITVGGIPSFLADLPFHLDSYFAASECAKRHAKKVFKYICHLLSLLAAFRTYRIVVKAGLYCAIIPGACLAEAFPFTDFSAALRVTIGLIVWAGLLVGAIVVSNAAEVNDDTSTAAFVHDTRMSLLAWCGAVFGVLLASALSVSSRPTYLKPDCHAVRSPELTWSHILAVLTGPVEAVQLSAVVLYFFWDYARGNDNNSVTVDARGQGLLPSLGGDSFAAALLVWAPSPDSDAQYNNGVSSSSDGSSETGFRSSVMVAALLVIVWALLVAAPIATSVAEGSRRREKVMAFKHSPVYEFLVVVLSRLLTVWIIATLMRSTSCVHVNNSTDDGDGFAVVSTAQNVSCGEGDWWASVASLSLLAYYMLTSSILHADDADLLRSAVATKDSTVKYAPLYALCVRAAQFFVCAACFAGFYAQSALIPLIPILVMSVLVSVLPPLMALFQGKAPAQAQAQQNMREELESQQVRFNFSGTGVCSVAGVATLRSAGFVCVGWTAIVCIVRAMGRAKHGIWASETTVYVGWGVVYLIAVAYSIHESRQAHAQWLAVLSRSGLATATQSLLQTLQTATVSESVLGKIVLPPKDAPGAQVGVFVSKFDKMRVRPVDVYTRKIQSARSCGEMAKILLQIEEDIITERMTCLFLMRRTAWVQELQNIIERSHEDEMELLRDPSMFINWTSAVPSSNGALTFQQLPVEVDRAIVVQLMALDFSENSSIRAVRATRNGGLNECLNWLFDHHHDADLHDPLPRRGDVSSTVTTTALSAAATSSGAHDFEAHFSVHPTQLEAASSVQSDQTLTTTAASHNYPDAPPVAPVSRPVARLLMCIRQLGDGISQHPASTHVSRQVFTIFMSRKVPSEVCWLIFSFTMSSEELRAVLLSDNSTAAGQQDALLDEYGYSRTWYGNMPEMRTASTTSSPTKTAEMMRYAGYYLFARQERIARAKISANEMQEV